MRACATRKIGYGSEQIAEEALIEAWVRYGYAAGEGPIAVYLCEYCKEWHFTSQGVMNASLASAIEDGSIRKRREAGFWEDKLKF